jgi:uncharacterized repeat protein (TIGR03803 family)
MEKRRAVVRLAALAGVLMAASCGVDARPSYAVPGGMRQGSAGEVLRNPRAWTENVLYRFQGGMDGAHPYSSLLLDGAGALYGTSSVSGSTYGNVFKLTPSGSTYTESVLHSFQGGNDAQTPHSALITDGTGALYGTTEFGGQSLRGTAFKLTPSGSGYRETVLYSFKGYPNEGEYPESDLIADASGALYGTTYEGGTAGSNYGTVFKLTPSASGYQETAIWSFAWTDGAHPYAALLAGKGGTLFGTTAEGGSHGRGTVFELAPSTTGYSERVLYDFKGGNDGAYPYSRLIQPEKTGPLYGTTYGGGGSGCHNYGCGTVFRLTRSAARYEERVLYRFRGYPTDGAFPYAGLLAGKAGALYGTTFEDYSTSYGTVFDLIPSGTSYKESILHRFVGGTDGGFPWGDLIADAKGALYGTTFQGGGTGSGSGFGTVFKLTP